MPEAARVVVEYGAGNGTLTEALLKRLGNPSRLVGIEVNADFVADLKRIRDERLEVVHGDVVEMAGKLRELAPNGVDAVVSGIPFSFLSPEARLEICRATREGLAENGRFIVYQNSLLMRKVLRKTFAKVETHFEPRNVFPYFIMVASR